MNKLSKTEQQAIHHFQKIYRVVSVLACVLMIVVLLVTVSYLPSFGNPNNPANNEVPARYIEQGLQENGALNIVAGMILDYRAFDTFGESFVLFISVNAIIMLLKREKGQVLLYSKDIQVYEPKKDQIFQTVATYLIPCILLFGIYIVLNGHLSPGGGFSGGAIMGAGLILYNVAFGMEKANEFISEKTFTVIVTSALLFYAFSKGYSFYTGANHLPSLIPLGRVGDILSGGLILPLNIAVGLIVACTIYGIFIMFSRGGF